MSHEVKSGVNAGLSARGINYSDDGHSKLSIGGGVYAGVGGAVELSVDLTNINNKIIGYTTDEDELMRQIKFNIGRK